MAEDNKAIIRRLYIEAFNRRDLPLLDELYMDDVELHVPGLPEDPFGVEPIRQLFAMMHAAFPDVRAVIEDLMAEGDKVTARVSFHSERQKPYEGPMGLSPQQPLPVWTHIHIFRMFSGQIVEQWGDRDDWSLLRQVGVVPAPAQKPKVYATGQGPQ
jgi:predicted ester cyclase